MQKKAYLSSQNNQYTIALINGKQVDLLCYTAEQFAELLKSMDTPSI